MLGFFTEHEFAVFSLVLVRVVLNVESQLLRHDGTNDSRIRLPLLLAFLLMMLPEVFIRVEDRVQSQMSRAVWNTEYSQEVADERQHSVANVRQRTVVRDAHRLNRVEAGEGAHRGSTINDKATGWAFELSEYDWNDFTPAVSSIVRPPEIAVPENP